MKLNFQGITLNFLCRTASIMAYGFLITVMLSQAIYRTNFSPIIYAPIVLICLILMNKMNKQEEI